jgi:hypothetical protein
MGHCCARCGRFGEWKKYRGKGSYKGRYLCQVCKTVKTISPKPKTRKRDRSGEKRERYLEEVAWRAS